MKLSDDVQIPELTLEQFASELKALLRKASEAGLDPDDFCAVAEHILESDWA
jgi:hypothetical protein